MPVLVYGLRISAFVRAPPIRQCLVKLSELMRPVARMFYFHLMRPLVCITLPNQAPGWTFRVESTQVRQSESLFELSDGLSGARIECVFADAYLAL
jgi:hypothetical protein